jgi:hypothetical protein
VSHQLLEPLEPRLCFVIVAVGLPAWAQVFNDLNANGVQEAKEPPLADGRCMPACRRASTAPTSTSSARPMPPASTAQADPARSDALLRKGWRLTHSAFENGIYRFGVTQTRVRVRRRVQ